MADVYGNSYDGGGMMGMGGTNNLVSPVATDNNIPSSQNSNENRRKPTEEQSLVPVTIAMILNSSNGMLQDGREPHQVKLVAAVRAVNNSSTANDYEMEDGTGALEVKEWFDESEPQLKFQIRAEAAVDHQYVRVIGKIQNYDGRISLLAFAVRKLSSGNELTHHFLEVVHSQEKYKRSNQIVGSPGGMPMGAMNMAGAPSTTTPLAQDMNSGGNELMNDILRFLEVGGDENGRDIREFVQMSAGKHSEPDIMTMVANLSNGGEIYSTSDEHFYAKV